MKTSFVFIAILILGILVAVWYLGRNQFPLPAGETTLPSNDSETRSITSRREILATDGVKHSIPLNEILSGGPPKDGIPSIDDPKFILAGKADFLKDSDPGLGLTIDGESRFYPYRILVWHEMVNDKMGDTPVLVTYCPLCATGIVFERKVNGEEQEFGVSGKLWQSNLLMYNRASQEENESLWSQVLGEAVLGVNTGEKLKIIPSEITRWGDWKKANSNTKVLSQDTGAFRSYGLDPYEDYYTSESVSFGAEFRDTRLHPKALVHGIEINGEYKAYADEAIKQAGITDSFAEKEIRIERTTAGGVRFTTDGAALPSVPGFWFSWLAVHPETELFK
ncbi:MAG: DUF3179 domain-containing protein [Parcubacteria group bacterium]